MLFDASGREVIIKRLSAPDIDVRLAAGLQRVGRVAWDTALPNRGMHQIERIFNPNNRQIIDESKARYQSFARHGALIVAYANGKGGYTPIGFAMSRNDVTGNVVSKNLKRIATTVGVSNRVYAWNAQTNVVPYYQNQGVGLELLKQSMEIFKSDQIPAVYIFDENKLATSWYMHRGYKLDPEDQTSSELAAYRYFGDDNPRVDQYRYTAESAEEVIYGINSSSRGN